MTDGLKMSKAVNLRNFLTACLILRHSN